MRYRYTGSDPQMFPAYRVTLHAGDVIDLDVDPGHGYLEPVADLDIDPTDPAGDADTTTPETDPS